MITPGYDTLEALVEAEANGWVATLLISDGTITWPWTCGPYATQKEAEAARARNRKRFNTEQKKAKREGLAPFTCTTSVRPLWKG